MLERTGHDETHTHYWVAETPRDGDMHAYANANANANATDGDSGLGVGVGGGVGIVGDLIPEAVHESGCAMADNQNQCCSTSKIW